MGFQWTFTDGSSLCHHNVTTNHTAFCNRVPEHLDAGYSEIFIPAVGLGESFFLFSSCLSVPALVLFGRILLGETCLGSFFLVPYFAATSHNFTRPMRTSWRAA